VSLFRQYLAQRLLASAVTLLGVSVIVFLMVRVLPGDPAQVLAQLPQFAHRLPANSGSGEA
jgi:ABC-type dipeptide/oligopeptide/nickel transport system permease component